MFELNEALNEALNAVNKESSATCIWTHRQTGWRLACDSPSHDRLRMARLRHSCSRLPRLRSSCAVRAAPSAPSAAAASAADQAGSLGLRREFSCTVLGK